MDRINVLASRLPELYETMYKQIEPFANYIINNKITNIKTIDKTLDYLLDIPTDKAYRLLESLCNYYMPINKENALFYLNEYHEIWSIEETHLLKKSKRNNK